MSTVRFHQNAASSVVDKENVTNQLPVPLATSSIITSKPAVQAVLATIKPVPVDTLTHIALSKMTNPQLREELKKRGLPHSGNKDALFKRLGVPPPVEQQWRKGGRQVKMPEPKQELKNCGLKIGGAKEGMLGRLGVPTGFEKSFLDKITRDKNEILKKRKQHTNKAVVAVHQKKQKKLSPEDDPAHEEYTVQCCKASRFPVRGDRVEPAGYIDWPDGSVAELYRCLACGKIPQKPNAPPIHEYSDNEDDDYSEGLQMYARGLQGARFLGEGRPRNDEECIIQ